MKPLRRSHLAVLAVALLALGGFMAIRGKPGNAGPASQADPARAQVLEFTQADLFLVEPRAFARSLPITGSLMTLTEATVKA